MILSYALRLVCLGLASFFVLNLVLSLVTRFFAHSGIRLAEGKEASIAARFLLLLRLFPAAAAGLFVLGLCVPSYLWLEPSARSEKVGIVCLGLGLFGLASCSLSALRGARAIVLSLLHNHRCGSHGTKFGVAAESSPLLVVSQDAPLLALSGLLRPRLLVSLNVLETLSSEELEGALLHERAHRGSHDNFKRLLLLLAPDAFPFVSTLNLLEVPWAKFTEWAADDRATAGNQHRAAALASALVRVARMGSASRLPFLATALLAGDCELSARVERLLRVTNSIPTQPARLRRYLRIFVGLLVPAALTTVLVATPALAYVHDLLELLVR
ncbi:MAG TPA: M56 family metallopeptidase [Candidatus Acidoferrum sp.]|nr:M56 family metallopeptidase [Candidatus Acidoferrum sp.]